MRNLINVRWGGSTGMARGACGSLVALRRRLSPGLPLTAALDEGNRDTTVPGIRAPKFTYKDCGMDGTAQAQDERQC